MADLAHSLAVAVTELGTLTAAVPGLLGADHPEARLLQEAFGDVATGLFTAIRCATGGETSAAMEMVDRQLRALCCIRELITDLDPAPARASDLDEAVGSVCGLLNLDTDIP